MGSYISSARAGALKLVSIESKHSLPPAGGEGGEDVGGFVTEEADAAIGEEEVRAARVEAPEMHHVAHVVEPAGLEPRKPAAAVREVRGAGGGVARSRTPRIMSAVPVQSTPTPAYHQPVHMSGLGGRSPTRSVLLVPSVMSVNLTCELLNNEPSLRECRRPATPR